MSLIPECCKKTHIDPIDEQQRKLRSIRIIYSWAEPLKIAYIRGGSVRKNAVFQA